MADQWEYLYIEWPTKEKLDTAGADGWELVAVQVQSFETPTAVLKRKK
jgi:hypothetical protein